MSTSWPSERYTPPDATAVNAHAFFENYGFVGEGLAIDPHDQPLSRGHCVEGHTRL